MLGKVALGAKSLLGKVGKGKSQPKVKAQPVTPKVEQPKVGPPPSAAKSEPTSAPTVSTSRKSASSPMLKRTGMIRIDDALTNVSKSIGNIKSTLFSKQKFEKGKEDRRKKALVGAKRKSRETKAEGTSPVKGVVGFIKNNIPGKSLFSNLLKFLTQLVFGAITLYIIQNAKIIIEKIKEVAKFVENLFEMMNKYLFEPLYKMVKAIAEPINNAIKELAPDSLPNFAKEKTDIENKLDELDLENNKLAKMIPGLEKIIKGFNNFVKTGDPRISPEEFDQQVRDRQPQDGSSDSVPPSQRPAPSGDSSPTSPSQPPSQRPAPSTPGAESPGAAPGGGMSSGLSGILKFISAGEGGYNAMNQGTRGNRIVGSTQDSRSKVGKNLTDMSIGEIMERQAYIMDTKNPQVSNYGLFAVGRYQIIPDTMPRAVKYAGLSRGDKFTPSNQDKLGVGLIKGDAPAAWAYITGKSNDIDAAVNSLAAVWASIPTTSGRSAYGQGNAAGHSVSEVKRALRDARKGGVSTTSGIRRTSNTQPPSLRPAPTNLSGVKGGGDLVFEGDGSGWTGKLYFRDGNGKRVGPSFFARSGVNGTQSTSQEMRKNVSGRNYPIPDGNYKLLQFQQHGPWPNLAGIGHWSTFINNASGQIGSRGGVMLHSDIGNDGTAGCVGVDLGGSPGTKQEQEFLKIYKAINPGSIKVNLRGNQASSIPDRPQAQVGTGQGGRPLSRRNLDRRTSYDGNRNTTVVMPIDSGGANGMMSGPNRSGGTINNVNSGRNRASSAHTYLRSTANAKLYKYG